MSRIEQDKGKRGSLKWIQRAVNERWADLDQPILAKVPRALSINWSSSLVADNYAEYRDAGFLARLELSDMEAELAGFWPARGPQWDALGRTDAGHVLLVEAKAHVQELCSSSTAAGPESRGIIEKRLAEVASRLGARNGHAPWADQFYQLGNRLAHLEFLRQRGVPAYLVLVNFLNDSDMSGPTTIEAWQAAYDVALHVMGLGRRHALSAYMVDVYPDVSRYRDGPPPSPEGA